MKKFMFDYDTENDDLFLYLKNKKSQGSVELGKFIFDYNYKNELVGLEIIDATEQLKDFIHENKNNIKDILLNLKDCKIDIIAKDNLMVIKLFLASRSQKLSPIISIPSITQRSPALNPLDS